MDKILWMYKIWLTYSYLGYTATWFIFLIWRAVHNKQKTKELPISTQEIAKSSHLASSYQIQPDFIEDYEKELFKKCIKERKRQLKMQIREESERFIAQNKTGAIKDSEIKNTSYGKAVRELMEFQTFNPALNVKPTKLPDKKTRY